MSSKRADKKKARSNLISLVRDFFAQLPPDDEMEKAIEPVIAALNKAGFSIARDRSIEWQNVRSLGVIDICSDGQRMSVYSDGSVEPY